MTWLRAHLISDWNRLWSVWLHAAFTAVGAVYAVMPVLDPSIAAMLPAPQQAKAIGAYALVGLLVRIVKQKSNA